jgi:hypothetical protein
MLTRGWPSTSSRMPNTSPQSWLKGASCQANVNRLFQTAPITGGAWLRILLLALAAWVPPPRQRGGGDQRPGPH